MKRRKSAQISHQVADRIELRVKFCRGSKLLTACSDATCRSTPQFLDDLSSRLPLNFKVTCIPFSIHDNTMPLSCSLLVVEFLSFIVLHRGSKRTGHGIVHCGL
jgi:hypothetical protein